MDLNKTAPWISIGGSLRVGDVWYQGNRYYAQHVENILGELKEITGRFGREITVVPNGNLQEQLDAAISRMSATFSAEPTIEEIGEDETEVFSIPDGVKPFTYYIEDNRLYYADNHTAKPFSGDSNSTRAIRMMVDIVQKYDHIIMSQRCGCTDEVFEAERLALNSAYDDFVNRYGSLSSAANQLGGVVATLLAGVLANISWRMSFLVYLMGLISIVLCLIFMPNDRIRSGESADAEKGHKPFIKYICHAFT